MEPQNNIPDPVLVNQSMNGGGGSKILVVVTIILFAAILGMGGFGYIKWQAYKTKVGSLGADINALNARVAELTTQLEENQTNTTASQDYLSMGELDVRIKRSNELKDAFYFISKDGLAYISTRSILKTNTISTGNPNTYCALAWITDKKDLGGPEISAEKTINGKVHYLKGSDGRGTCPDADQTTVTKTRTALIDSFKNSLEAIPVE